MKILLLQLISLVAAEELELYAPQPNLPSFADFPNQPIEAVKPRQFQIENIDAIDSLYSARPRNRRQAYVQYGAPVYHQQQPQYIPQYQAYQQARPVVQPAVQQVQQYPRYDLRPQTIPRQYVQAPPRSVIPQPQIAQPQFYQQTPHVQQVPQVPRQPVYQPRPAVVPKPQPQPQIVRPQPQVPQTYRPLPQHGGYDQFSNDKGYQQRPTTRSRPLAQHRNIVQNRIPDESPYDTKPVTAVRPASKQPETFSGNYGDEPVLPANVPVVTETPYEAPVTSPYEAPVTAPYVAPYSEVPVVYTEAPYVEPVTTTTQKPTTTARRTTTTTTQRPTTARRTTTTPRPTTTTTRATTTTPRPTTTTARTTTTTTQRPTTTTTRAPTTTTTTTTTTTAAPTTTLPVYDDTFVGQYYYGVKNDGNYTFPLPSCFFNPSGYVCCNLLLNELMSETYKDVAGGLKFNKCNIQKMANHLQVMAEKMFDSNFETIIGFEDFSQKIHFRKDLVCKVHVDGRYILAYATPTDTVSQEKIIPPVPAKNIVKDSIALRTVVGDRIAEIKEEIHLNNEVLSKRF